MRRSRLFLVFLLVPAPLFAQASTSLSTFVAAGSGIEGTPVLVGGALTSEMGRIGLRLGVGIDGRDTPLGGALRASGNEAAWAADLDVVGSAGGLVRALSPYYITAGLGVRSVTRNGSSSMTPVASVGAGYRADLVRRIGIEAETRYRTPLAGSTPVGSSGVEFRLGLSLRVHGGGDREAPQPRARRSPPPPPAVTAPRVSAAAPVVVQRVLQDASQYLGTSYLWGGSNPDKGFDCSGFVQHVFAKQGIRLPRVSRDQAAAGSPLSMELDKLQPGDLLLFASDGSWIDHVAIYAGDGWILHSSSSGGGVRYDQLSGPRGDWYVRKLVGARRVVGT
ncbi:hypothetical protein BH23GEM3_BH23GEM3_25860 [soil metagenome]